MRRVSLLSYFLFNVLRLNWPELSTMNRFGVIVLGDDESAWLQKVCLASGLILGSAWNLDGGHHEEVTAQDFLERIGQQLPSEIQVRDLACGLN